jgi:hypothetical protein
MASAAERLSDGASEEKKIGDALEERHTIENLPDPDAGLSDEERAAQVCPSLSFVTLLANATIGSQTALETRPKAHPMAFILVPHLLPRPHQHWQCESRWPARRSSHDQWTVQ